jgi:hypothetical protein
MVANYKKKTFIIIKMAEATLKLAAYAKPEALSVVVCHVHFCGLTGPAASKVTSFWLPATGDTLLHITVPSRATAVCVSLVWRYRGGWLRHGR